MGNGRTNGTFCRIRHGPRAYVLELRSRQHLLLADSPYIWYYASKLYSRERQRLAPYSPKGTPANCGLLGELKGLHLEVSDQHK